MNYQYKVINKNPIVVSGEFGVYSFVARLNRISKDGVADSNVVQLKILCGGEVIVHYDYGWITGYRFISLYRPLVEHLDKVKVRRPILRIR